MGPGKTLFKRQRSPLNMAMLPSHSNSIERNDKQRQQMLMKSANSPCRHIFNNIDLFLIGGEQYCSL